MFKQVFPVKTPNFDAADINCTTIKYMNSDVGNKSLRHLRVNTADIAYYFHLVIFSWNQSDNECL